MAEEKTFETRVKRCLKESGAWFIKYWGGGVHTMAGIPDILACVHGKFVAVEVKASTGRPSMLQLRTMDSIRESFGKAVLLYPKDERKFHEWVSSGCRSTDWYRENIRMQESWKERLRRSHED